MTRAQEAEENYIIKRELAVVKQRCTSATENLQRAQSTIRQLQDQQVGGPTRPQTAPRVPVAPRVPLGVPMWWCVELVLPASRGRGSGTVGVPPHSDVLGGGCVGVGMGMGMGMGPGTEPRGS